jgi:type VI secretion system VgrG family protein
MATYLSEKSFLFETEASDPKTKKRYEFAVVRFSGVEEIGRLYEFDITLMSDNAEVDLGEVLSHAARLYLRADKKLPIHGVISSFEIIDEVDRQAFYRAKLVPKLWRLNLFKMSEVYLGVTVPELIPKVLKEGGLAPSDFELRLKRKYRRWSQICQYQETHFNFLSRWMEREGIYYFWEQTGQGAKLIITDTRIAHMDLPGEKPLNYSPPSGLELGQEASAVSAFLCRQQPVPRKVTLQDFNHRKSPPIVEGSAEVSSKGEGEVIIYGEHVKDTQEAQEYAKLRAEGLLSRQRLYHGESTAAYPRVGWFFDLKRHFRKGFNRKYLLIGISHAGSQAAFLMSSSVKIGEDERQSFYRNSFTGIESDLQFRSELTTPRPRFYGTINAKVSAEGNGQYAEIDQYGRYKVKLPFDRSDRWGQKASRWIRMAEPYAGPSEGFHFPLRKGAEVLLSFMDGDPDRPIIASAAPATEAPNVVVDHECTFNRIETAGDNLINLQDLEENQSILLKSPPSSSWARVGSHNDDPPLNSSESQEDEDGIRMQTSGNMWLEARNRYAEYTVGGPTVRDDVPEGVKYLWDKFYGDSPAFAPEGMAAYGYSGATGETPVADADLADMASLARKGRVRLVKGDTFNTQEGNIYDFGGYWNYNLGNSYLEQYMDQSEVELNQLEAHDRAGAGGPNYGSISSLKGDGYPGQTDHGGSVWVSKKYSGAEYAYNQEMDSLEVKQDCVSISHRYGCRMIEYQYCSEDDEPFTKIDNQEGLGIKDEWAYDSGAVYKWEHTDDQVTYISEFKWGMEEKNSAEFSLGVSFSFKFEGNAKVEISLALAASFSLEIKFGAELKITTGIGFAGEMDLSLGAGLELERDGKFHFKATGFRAEVKALVEAHQKQVELDNTLSELKAQQLLLQDQLVDLTTAELKVEQGLEILGL